MTTIATLIRFAGLGQFALIPVNFVAARKLRYAANLSGASPVVRDIFYVHAFYILFVLAGLGALSLGATEFLAGGTPLARSTCGYIAAFWGLRVGIQLFYYDKEERRRHRVLDVGFLGLFAFLASVFAVAAAGETA